MDLYSPPLAGYWAVRLTPVRLVLAGTAAMSFAGSERIYALTKRTTPETIEKQMTDVRSKRALMWG